MKRTRTDANVVNREDIGVVQCGRGLGLLLEAAHEVGLVGERLGQNLQRDVALQSRIASPIHLAHAAAANQLDDFIDADASARRKGHLISEAGSLLRRGPLASSLITLSDVPMVTGSLIRNRCPSLVTS